MRMRITVWMVVSLFLLSGAAHAGRHMEYVDGVTARGYRKLAIEHLLTEMIPKQNLPQQDRILIPFKLGSLYDDLSQRETELDAREAHLQKASQYLDEFASKNPRHPRILDVRLKKVNVISGQAQIADSRFVAEQDPTKKKELRKKTGDLYRKGIDEAQKIIDATKKKEDEFRGKRNNSKKYMAQFWLYYGARVRGLFQQGQMEYLWAQLYPAPAGTARMDPKKHPDRKKHLDAALKYFQSVEKQRPKNNVTFTSYIRRGMCQRELALFGKNSTATKGMREKAIKAFDLALSIATKPGTGPIRAEASYQKALTAFELGKYKAAANSAEAYIANHPSGKASFRGQSALLLKARSLGLQAKRMKDERTVGWEAELSDARRTLKDVDPNYFEIRKQADKLVSDWERMFPDAPDIKAAAISPIIAAAEAKKFFGQKRMAEAIEKYREVITLSGSDPDNVKFAEEAWRALGLIYRTTPTGAKRYTMASIAYRELLERFPNTRQGAEIAWWRCKMAAYQYTHSPDKDEYELSEYLDRLKFFIKRFPRDPRTFEAQTRSAEVYQQTGELQRAADIWASTAPGNPRYAESMYNCGELYRQVFFQLVDDGKGAAPETLATLDNCLKRLGIAVDAKLPPNAKENYNSSALHRMIATLVDSAAPQPASARKVPGLVDKFRKRFPQNEKLCAAAVLSGVRAYTIMQKPYEAEKLALLLETKYKSSEEYELVKQMMVVAFQKKDPPRATVWQRKKMARDFAKAEEGQLKVLGQRAWDQKNYALAEKCFKILVDRAGKDVKKQAGDKDELVKAEAKLFTYEQILSSLYYESGQYGKAVPIYTKFLAASRAKHTRENTGETRADFLSNLRSAAECEELGGDANNAVTLWREFLKDIDSPNPSDDWFRGKYQLANSYVRLKKYNEATSLIREVKLRYRGFGKNKDTKGKVKVLTEYITKVNEIAKVEEKLRNAGSQAQRQLITKELDKKREEAEELKKELGKP